MVPHKQRRRPTLFTGCEASTGKQILSALRNCRNNDDSSGRKKSGEGGPADRVNVFVKYNTSGDREERLRVVTQASVPGSSISQRANLSLFKLAKYSPAVTRARPRHKYTGSGVGWGHQLTCALSSIGMHSRLVCQLLANGHLTAAMSHIAAVNTHTPLIHHVGRGGAG